MTAIRPVFYVSDGTGITAETVGHSLLTQFSGFSFVTDRMSFVDDTDKAHEAARRIRAAGERYQVRPIVVSSCVDSALARILEESGALVLDVFVPFIGPLEQELAAARHSKIGQAHGMVDFDTYHRRINAMNFALSHDDGIAVNYDEADVVLVAVSRAGKTPTCIYLALHYGIRAANYPLTEEDLESDRLPPRLRPYRNKLFGLTIDPERLQQIRQERRPNSRYASAEVCRREVAAAETMFRMERIPTLSTTHTSIEEISSKVLGTLGLQREMF
ncbi:pyruvate, phosphate dikinase/phosphoenolpyruvate synthase regulator [Stenotrophomonas sp. MYb238]|jgi:regulator of PEP synthase PpsR (kinase-PPPase family)|uniref:posphoenolpyruvate synthetase regulatory kinase/phosphorylase PpsR n=1 Tax=Stenotrophomonas sp. MYb238 TaxID=2040281 RepID=UPI000E93E9BB|nr:pyruvate, water dikinase regulatory protein [Stenotrophomonas sp. MYb238]MQP74639.1 pyruvate, phosphate dikinase/phosphoenolpyruvate synthase regulator [Stenotrophomonas sp. MYb238]HBN52947.1 phosphoenolpyruvate synthase regulatory protein [Stenotrophomonas sp.]